MPGSITGAPAWIFMPPGRNAVKARCAKIAMALRPTMSLGRPGVCTSPAEIIVVTPPCSVESIQLIWLWRGVQSPATGWTWLSMRPGDTAQPCASTVVFAPSVSRSLKRPTAVIRPSTATIVSASRIGRPMSPLSSRPMFLMTSLPEGPAAGASCAIRVSPGTIGWPRCTDEWRDRLHTNDGEPRGAGSLAQGTLPCFRAPFVGANRCGIARGNGVGPRTR